MKNAASLLSKPSGPASLNPGYTAFEGSRRIASGALEDVARQTKVAADRGGRDPILIFDDLTGELTELDFRGTADEVVSRLARAEKTVPKGVTGFQQRGPGRPKLGVIPREVTLLPGHWDWLDGHPGGASAALRRLVYEAKRSGSEKDGARQSQEAVYRFMTTMAGNLPSFEEALRAFYRRDRQRFYRLVKAWPTDIRDHVKKLVAVASLNHPSAQEKADLKAHCIPKHRAGAS